MIIEIIGVVTLILGTIALFRRPEFAVYVFVAWTLLGAAAAILLPSFGWANIQPAHLFLGFLAVIVFSRKEFLPPALRSLSFPRAGFWLLLTTTYGVLSALLLPRVFAGDTYVYMVAGTALGPGLIQVPLMPSSGNVTQTIYVVADLICFITFYAFSSIRNGLEAVARAGLACAIINLLLGVADVVTYMANVAFVMDVIRNASYRMLEDTTVFGFKRIVGSFSEASAYAFTTLGLFAFAARLWTNGIYRRTSMVSAGLSLCVLLLSTSGTAYVGLFLYCAVAYLVSWSQVVSGRVPRAVMGFVGLGPSLAAILILSLALHSPTGAVVQEILESAVFNKLSSESGLERVRWNEQALRNFLDTFGFGVGLGSVRASSFIVAVPASIGVLGALLYAGFLFIVFFQPRPRSADPLAVAVQQAARSACLALLIAGSISGPFVDLGLPFFIFAGVACAEPVLARSTSATAPPGPPVPPHLRPARTGGSAQPWGSLLNPQSRYDGEISRGASKTKRPLQA
jgi:hypothetical protein